MAAKKVPRDFWERMLKYPSFDNRFAFVLFVVGGLFLLITYDLVLDTPIVEGMTDQIALLNLIIQGAMLVFGIFAAYYALRQLIETRLNSLEEGGMQELKRKHYSRAYQKWSESFYIRPEAPVFISLTQVLLLLGDFGTFDEYMRMTRESKSLRRQLSQEESDQVLLLYLKAMRHLLVKNQGEAEKYLAEIVELVKAIGLNSFQWDFIDIRVSQPFLNLSGECLNMAENLISYLEKRMPEARLVAFEGGDYASLVEEVIADQQTIPVQENEGNDLRLI